MLVDRHSFAAVAQFPDIWFAILVEIYISATLTVSHQLFVKISVAQTGRNKLIVVEDGSETVAQLLIFVV